MNEEAVNSSFGLLKPTCLLLAKLQTVKVKLIHDSGVEPWFCICEGQSRAQPLGKAVRALQDLQLVVKEITK